MPEFSKTKGAIKIHPINVQEHKNTKPYKNLPYTRLLALAGSSDINPCVAEASTEKGM